MDVPLRTQAAAPAASLAELSRVLEETARILRDHAAACPAPAQSNPQPVPPPDITPQRLRAIIELRRLRGDWLGLKPGDPEWTMLLELLAARLERREHHQLSLAQACALPGTTTLRHARRLAAAGLITLTRAPAGSRRLAIALPDEVAARISAYLEAALPTSKLLV